MNVFPRVIGPRVAGKNHADKTLFQRDPVTNFELRFVPAACDRSMWGLLHLSHCDARVETRSVDRKVSSRMTLSTPQNRRYLRILRLSVRLLIRDSRSAWRDRSGRATPDRDRLWQVPRSSSRESGVFRGSIRVCVLRRCRGPHRFARGAEPIAYCTDTVSPAAIRWLRT